MLDHVTIGVADVGAAKVFYDRALLPLGITRLYAEGETFAGYGVGEKAFFWIGQRGAAQSGVHVAFAAADRAAVDRFYVAALAAGEGIMGRRGCGRIIMRIIMARLCWTRMGIMWRRFAMGRRTGAELRDAGSRVGGQA